MPFSHKRILLVSLLSAFIVISVFFVNCSEDKLELAPTTTTSFTPPSTNNRSTTTTRTTTSTNQTYGACARGVCTEPFCEENCESPDKCHVKDVDGICYPSCGYLAQISLNGKYGGYGPDGQQGTEDDPHTLIGFASPFCEDLVRWGADDWREISLVDNRAPFEVIEGSAKQCCGSDQQLQR